MTTDKQFDVSRRTVLAGLGTVGVAAAGAGLGTTALFNDTERFVGNSLRAGTFDLLVDWQQTYDGPNGHEYVNAYPDFDDDGVQDRVPQSFVIWAKREGYDLSDAQGKDDAIAAFKDAFFADIGEGNDWDQPLVALDDVKPGDSGEVTFSMHFFDNPAYVRLVGDLVAESENGQTEPEALVDPTAEGAGELADNVDVLLWSDDGDNVYEPKTDEVVDVVVLFDTSCSMVWADSSAGCSASENTAAPEKFAQAKAGAKALFTELLAEPDVSGLGLPADMLPTADVNVGLIEYGNSTGLKNSLGASLGDLEASIDAMSAGNSTELPTALEAAKAELDANGRDGAHTCVVVLGDGQPHETGNNVGDDAYDYDDWGATYSVELTDELEDEYDAHVVTVHYEVDPDVDLATGIDTDVVPAGYDYGSDIDTIELFEIMASPVSDDLNELERLAFAADRDRLTCVLHRIAHMCAGEVPLFYGTLSEAMAVIDDGDGVLLVSNPRTANDPAFGEDDAMACLEWSCTYYLGFEWSVDIDVGNEIQSDTLEFEIGFEAEQCRHNPTPFAPEPDAQEPDAQA
jgi:predicted ribosomally synthesized peptide with SipW-like signal peptide